MEEIVTLIGLTGFLGFQSDFDGIFSDIRLGISPDLGTQMYSLSSDQQYRHLPPEAEALDLLSEQIQKTKGPRIAIGYSFGGRLLLNLLAKQPDLFEGAIFLSTNPGLVDAQARKLREVVDQKWAQRFLTEEWNELLYSWNSQDVFKGSTYELHRSESNYNRPQLAWALTEFSVGKQPNYRNLILDLAVPQLWLMGERDQRYSQLGHELDTHLKNKGTSSVEIVPSAGHRIFLDQPSVVSQKIISFIEQL